MIASEKLMEKRSEKDSDNNLYVNKEVVYYAVYVPGPKDPNATAKHVYLEKNEALRAAKENPGGRFKAFKKRAEAEQFALQGNDQTIQAMPAQTGLIGEEKLNNFKAPWPQSLVTFRKLIESGNLEEVKKIIWENPRYLISSCDTPTILQEGCRYNALHVAIRSPEPAKVCDLILNTITDKQFLRLFYGDQNDETYARYSELLVDRFINTPDKALNETPLHFASKFGYKDMVQVLVSYPQCVKTFPNKHGNTPIDLICTRKNQSEKLKLEINTLLQEQYYVPVLRSDDDTVQPMIGEPFSPSNPPKLNVDPMSPPMRHSALAGPMTLDKASEFHKIWKTPPRRNHMLSPNPRDYQSDLSHSTLNNPVLNLTTRLQDTEKGLERIGRELAEERHVSWKEYWPFLNDWVDLHTENGLVILEAYLKSKMSYPPVYCAGEENKIRKKDVKNSTLDEINNLCEKFQATKLFDEDSEDDEEVSEREFVTPPTSPLISSDDSEDEDDYCMAEEGTTTFIEGDQATKVDYAVYNAIPKNIDPDEFPYITYWKHEMQILFQQNYRFPGKTPARTRFTLTPERTSRQLKPMKIDFNLN